MTPCATSGCSNPGTIEHRSGQRLCWSCATRAAGVSVPPPAPRQPRTMPRLTEAEKTRMQALRAEGRTYAEIAAVMGKTKQAINETFARWREAKRAAQNS